MPWIKILNRKNHPFTNKIKVHGVSIEIILIAAFVLIVLFLGAVYFIAPAKKSALIYNSPLQRLLAGNDRFSDLQPIHPDEDVQRLREAAVAQHPFAVVVCCSDSRVSPELIFDEGIGNLFVIRTAGNIIGGLEIGSIEYAVEHLNVKLIVVMGHEKCGAIKAFIEGGEISGHIKDIVDSIKEEIEIKAISLNGANRMNDCIKANVQHGINQLMVQSRIIREKVKNKQVDIVGLRYDLDDLSVKILNQ